MQLKLQCFVVVDVGELNLCRAGGHVSAIGLFWVANGLLQVDNDIAGEFQTFSVRHY